MSSRNLQESVNLPAKTGKILRTLVRGCGNILGTSAMTDCRRSHAEAAFSTTNSFVGVLASSNSVSGISAFGTIITARVKRRQVAASRVAPAWRRNTGFAPVIADESLQTENEIGRDAVLIVWLLFVKTSVVNLFPHLGFDTGEETVRLRGWCASEREETALRRGDSDGFCSRQKQESREIGQSFSSLELANLICRAGDRREQLKDVQVLQAYVAGHLVYKAAR
jgi:hypothetical protein